ncbi:ribonuclease HII [Pseudovibrio exalbescens]|uniref:ribonuclease HII n=1 Tax=Pseudovibrio exalbescens TaxID=197461 RepID=UPI0023652F8D|nr:ribonuclease HII [Pseudovibrio exalbescens]MDD7911253.1 ribonuclease HII [Pseudovibrio exalbescens]
MAYTQTLFDSAFPEAPDAQWERSLRNELGGPFAGVDEAGRGPWAGPVVIAAAVLDYDNLPVDLNDSKKLSEAKREALYSEIMEKAQVSVCVQSPKTIDRLNIRAATLAGMALCIRALPVMPVKAFFDGRDVPSGVTVEAQALVKGDGRCLAISAASIVAKVTRDRLMVKLDACCPGYGFAKHKGYGTKDHQEALLKLGPSVHHRRSFRPIKDMK